MNDDGKPGQVRALIDGEARWVWPHEFCAATTSPIVDLLRDRDRIVADNDPARVLPGEVTTVTGPWDPVVGARRERRSWQELPNPGEYGGGSLFDPVDERADERAGKRGGGGGGGFVGPVHIAAVRLDHSDLVDGWNLLDELHAESDLDRAWVHIVDALDEIAKARRAIKVGWIALAVAAAAMAVAFVAIVAGHG